MKLVLAVLAGLLALTATAQPASSALAGTWTLVSDIADPAGRKAQTLGASPRGTLIFAADGNYALVTTRSNLPRLVSNNRDRGTDDENRAIVAGSLAHAGRYTVSEKDGTFTWQVHASTFPNWTGTSRTLGFRLSGDELRTIVPSSSATPGGSEALWRRSK